MTSTVFIGGSRHVSRLSEKVKERLNNVINSGHNVVVGDANGADKAVQKYLSEAGYDKVTVFCSGNKPRNNIGHWNIHSITPPKGAKGFQFYAAKDREMANAANFGLMIWDSKSPGTVLNVLRLLMADKIAVLINVPGKKTYNIKSAVLWNDFLSSVDPKLLSDLRERATADEWKFCETSSQPNLFEYSEPEAIVHERQETSLLSEDELVATVNAALTISDPTAFVNALGKIARAQGMSQVAKQTGLARESLYRSLDADGNPEFATVLKVMAAVGIRLEASKQNTDNSA